MKMTNYDAIAPVYDRNPLRRQIPRDELLAKVIASAHTPVVVDLGCGTGNYLRAQIEAFGPNVHWMGIDRSEAMLDQARAKELDADLLLADAAALPLIDASVDFVKIRFAHHHFADQAAAFREVRRVLKPGGILSLFNVAHEYSHRAWVYHYFPQTRAFDQERFVPVLELHRLLTALGFAVEIRVEVTVTAHELAELVNEARNRDMSQLNLIDDADYHAGLAALERDAAAQTHFVGDVALLHGTARC